MPDLDLIKQGKQGCGRLGEADPSMSSRSTKTATNAGDFAADLLQEHQTARRRFNEWLWPARPARPDHIKILPGCLVVVGDIVEEMRRKPALLDSLVHPDSGIALLSIALGHDASVFDLDGPLPEIPESNASKSGRERVIERARRDNLLRDAGLLTQSTAWPSELSMPTFARREPFDFNPARFKHLRRASWTASGPCAATGRLTASRRFQTFPPSPRIGEVRPQTGRMIYCRFVLGAEIDETHH